MAKLECTSNLSYTEWMNRKEEVVLNNEVVKIGKIELFPEEAAEIYERGLYIVAFRKVYQMHYSEAQGFYYAMQVHYKNDGLPLTKRGRFAVKTGKEVNDLLGFSLMNE